MLLVSDHPNKEQYDQYEQQWRQYEEQMSQKREYIQSRKKTLLESQQQAQAAAAASQPTMPQPDSSVPAPVLPSSAPSAFSAPVSTDTSSMYTSAMYGSGAATQLATSKPAQSGYPFPGGAAGHAYPMSGPGYGGHMPFPPAAPFPPHMGPGVPPSGQRFPHGPPTYPPASSGPGVPRPPFPGVRPPFGAGQTPASDSSENQKGFEQYGGDGEDSAAGAPFMPGMRPPFEAAGGHPPFGQRFRVPRPGAPNEFGIQAPFQPNQPRAGFAQRGPRPGFGPRPDMYAEGEDTSADVGDVTESDDQTTDVASSQFGSGFGAPGFGRGMRPTRPGMGPRAGLTGPGMGPRAGFPRGPRPMGMMPRPQAPGFSEETDENAEESVEWNDGMPAASGPDFGLRGMRPEGPRFTTPASGFAGRGDVHGPGPRAGDPRLMLRPGDPRAMMRGGLRPMPPGLCPPWLAGSGRGVPQWGQNFGESAADEEYDENAENQEVAEEDVGHEEGFDGDYEGEEHFEQEDMGFGGTGFGPPGFPHSQFGARPPGFGMEHPRFDMRGPRLGFGLRGPGGPGFGAGLRPRGGPVPLMDIRLRPPSAAQSGSKEESEHGQEGEENVGEEETEGLTEEMDQFAEQADVASGIGARMPFRPPFGPRGFSSDLRLRPPGSMMGALPHGMAGGRGGRWPRPGFGERLLFPGFRGPMPRFPRMPGDPGKGFFPEGGGFDLETGFGDVSEEDYLAAEADQWGIEPPNKDSHPLKLDSASDALAERYHLSQFT